MKFLIAVCGLVSALTVSCTHRIKPSPRPQNPMRASWIEVSTCKAVTFLKEFERELFNSGFARIPEIVEEPLVDFPNSYELQTAYLEGKKNFIYFLKNDYKRQEQTSDHYNEIQNIYRLSTCVQKQGEFYLTAFRNDLESTDRFWGRRFLDSLEKAAHRAGCRLQISTKVKNVGFWSETLSSHYFRNVAKGSCKEYFEQPESAKEGALQ